MPYSAVTQPRLVLRIQGGTRSSTEAVHSTWVSPNLTRHEPSAWREKPGSRETSRSWSGARPEGRMCSLLGIGTGAYGQVGRRDKRLVAGQPCRTIQPRRRYASLSIRSIVVALGDGQSRASCASRMTAWILIGTT